MQIYIYEIKFSSLSAFPAFQRLLDLKTLVPRGQFQLALHFTYTAWIQDVPTYNPFHSKSLQIAVLLLLIKSVAPLRNACNLPHNLIIHEIHYNSGLLKLGKSPFIELQFTSGSDDAPQGEVNLKNFGLLLIDFNNYESKLEDAFFVREAFDLSELSWPLTGEDSEKYFLIGPHPKADLPTNKVHTARKINKNFANDLFQPGAGKFLFLVLTHHPKMKLFAPKHWIKRNKFSRKYHVEGELLTYIRRNVHDAVIYTGSSVSKGPPRGCEGSAFQGMVDILFQDGKPRPPFVLPTDVSPRVRSLNKCGRLPKTPFDLGAFKPGKPTPKVDPTFDTHFRIFSNAFF